MHIGPDGAIRLLVVAASALLSACGKPVETSAAENLPDTPIFYVEAAAGSDTNHGRTLKAPFKTLNRAAGAVKPGWTVQVMSGTYTSDGTENPLTDTVRGFSVPSLVYVPLITCTVQPGFTAPAARFNVLNGAFRVRP